MTLSDPVFRVGILEVHPFGLFVAIGLVLGYIVALWRALRLGLPARYLPGMFIVVVLGSLLTARAAFVALHPATLHDGLLGVLALWRGGLSLAGGLIGGTILIALYTWSQRISLWPWADAVAPAVSLGLAVSMLGLPYSGEGWGQATAGPFFMHVSAELRPVALVNVTRFQPIFAYEAAGFAALTVLLAVLSWRQRRVGRTFTGSIGLTFLLATALGYGALRPLTLDASDGTLVVRTQMLCAAAAAVACGMLLIRLRNAQAHAAMSREIERMQRAPHGHVFTG